MLDIWIYAQIRDNEIDEVTYGLATEARRLLKQLDGPGQVTAVAMGPADKSVLESLGNYGVQRVLNITHAEMGRYQGERFGQALFELISKEKPACLLLAQQAETEDLAQRVAAMLNTALITRAMDFSMDAEGTGRAIRPIANGYLFEDVVVQTTPLPIVLFLPPVLFDTAPDKQDKAAVEAIPYADPADGLKTRTVEVIEAAPEDLDLEEADIIVAGGRGVGKGASFNLMHELAKVIGGTVGGTRPIIDWGDLPYERQIGQTGKYVAPRLIINCGISGANEYTAGMEKAQLVVAIDQNPRARMFRFADLGVVGDVHEILPKVISRIEEQK